jgi:lactate permease
MWEAWPLAIVGSLAYIAGQLPVAVYLGPYLPDVAGSILCFVCLLALLKVWRPATVRGYGGAPLSSAAAARTGDEEHGLSGGEIFQAWLPIIVLIIIVVLWTGPWSKIPAYVPFRAAVAAGSALEPGKTVAAAFAWAPGVGGSAIAVSWLVIAMLLRVNGAQLGEIVRRTYHQMWGACLVGVFIFGLAYVFNYSGMAASLASGFSKIGVWFIVVAPVLGWIGVALSGSNTSTNAMFGAFQLAVGKILGFPPVLLPSLNSVGAEVGKPVAPQTASVGVSTSRFVRNEGEVIRHNMGWTFVMLIWLIVIGVGFYWFKPDIAILH